MTLLVGADISYYAEPIKYYVSNYELAYLSRLFAVKIKLHTYLNEVFRNVNKSLPAGNAIKICT